MQKAQAQGIVRDTLQSDFSKDRFLYFAKNLLNKIDETKTFKYAGAYISEASRPYVSSYERIGQYIDPENNKIDILIVYLQKETSLERARTAQRNFVARYLKDRDEKDAGLVAFVAPDSADWRFSLVKMEYKFSDGKSGKVKVEEEFTPAKRWSFLVGKNENSHTAQSRLAPIVENDEINPTLKQLEDAFNIEKVTKEFFEKYRELFLRVHETLNDIIKEHPDIKADFADKNVNTVDFSKKLLGQIVFLYFLQKKGWFGVPRNKSWGNGDKKFLRTLFEEAASKDKNYFNDYLEPLFYEALAKERDDDFYSRFECKIPFLNGGLFDPISNYDWVNTAIDLPNNIFSNTAKDLKTGDIGNGILDIFDRYNFTVKEDEPLEKEVAVDPEMLGKVFENLLEVKDRKSKGTYYTPREIVHYMCEQSLINYLKTQTSVDAKKIERIIKQDILLTKDEYLKWKKEKKLPESKVLVLWENEWGEIDEALKNIKIVDPACGSGAFLVGMLNGIIRVRKLLQSFSDSRQGFYNLKEEAIRNNLYGVDIDPGAVEIAKLRLWLSLVVDEDDIKQIKPLPNLDYKIMQGNSLLEEFEGIKLFDEKLLQTQIIDSNFLDPKNQIISELQSQLLKFYGTNPQWMQKGKHIGKPQEVIDLEIKLRKILKEGKKIKETSVEQRDLFTDVVTSRYIRDELETLHKRFFGETNKKSKDELKRQIENLEWALIEATLKEQNKTPALKKLEEFKQSNTKPFFLWKLNFAGVFEDKGGFDVVIANPPYVRVDEIDDSFKNPYKKLFSTAVGKYDLYYLFFEKSFYLLNFDGFCIFISPNKFCAADSAFNLRRMMLENMNIEEILSTSKLKVFDTASNYPVISSLGKYMKDKKSFTVRQVTEFSLLDEKNVPNSYIATSEELGRLPNSVIPINTNRVAFDLLKRLYEPEMLLSEVLSISEGLRIQEKYESEEKQAFEIVKQYQFSKYSGIKKGSYITQKNLEKVVSAGTDRYSKIIAKKILIMEDGLKINATVDYKKMVPQGGVYFGVLIKQDIDIAFVLGILNSRLFSFIYEIMYAGMHMGGGWLRYRSKFLENLPINKNILAPEKKVVSSVVKLVDQILSVTSSADYQGSQAKQAKVRDIEHQIDELVYKLYGLTDEETKIVEGVYK